MKIYLHNIGCRLNFSELETIGRRFVAGGHELVAGPDAADMVIINTCAVTAGAAHDTRSTIRRVLKVNKSAKLVLTGCYATIGAVELRELCPDVHIVPNAEKELLPQSLGIEPGPDGESFEIPANESTSRTRAFVKVQDGCNNRCSFCVTALARGRERSRSAGVVISEIQALSAAGFQEAVLTGVHLGSYGRDLGFDSGLSGLIRAILEQTDIKRLRLSSLEPWDIQQDFFGLWENQRLMPHFHFPLQSGSDSVLSRMARRAGTEVFRNLVLWARAGIPDVNISTDIIVGFPGETEYEFRATTDFVREMEFGGLHVFSYSKRPGTAAAEMPDQVEGTVKKERARRIKAIGEELSMAFHSRFDGETRMVLWESANRSGKWFGYTDNYIRAHIRSEADLANRITPTLLSRPRPAGMTGEPFKKS